MWIYWKRNVSSMLNSCQSKGLFSKLSKLGSLMYWFHFRYNRVRGAKPHPAIKTALTCKRTLGMAKYYRNFLAWKQGSRDPALRGSSRWASDLLVWSLRQPKAESHSTVSADVWASVPASLTIALTTCLLQKVDIRGTEPSVNSTPHRWKVGVSGRKYGGIASSGLSPLQRWERKAVGAASALFFKVEFDNIKIG